MPFDRSQPLYLQAIDTLRNRIAAGDWAPGGLLPSEPKLAKSLGVSQGTVRKALQQMSRDGLLDRRQGVGTFVARRDLTSQATPFVDDAGTPLIAELRAQALRTSTLPEDIAPKLDQPADAPAWCIEQLSCLMGRPAIVERILIPKDYLSGLRADYLPADTPELWQRLAGRMCRTNRHQITACLAPADVAWAVGLVPGDPMTRISSVTLDLSGSPLEHRDIYAAPGPWSYCADHDAGKKW